MNENTSMVLVAIIYCLPIFLLLLYAAVRVYQGYKVKKKNKSKLAEYHKLIEQAREQQASKG